jgi:hypothetical protein
LLVHSTPERAQGFVPIPVSKPHFYCLSSFLPPVEFCLWMFITASDQFSARAIFVLPLRVLFSPPLVSVGCVRAPSCLSAERSHGRIHRPFPTRVAQQGVHPTDSVCAWHSVPASIFILSCSSLRKLSFPGSGCRAISSLLGIFLSACP